MQGARDTLNLIICKWSQQNKGLLAIKKKPADCFDVNASIPKPVGSKLYGTYYLHVSQKATIHVGKSTIHLNPML